MRQPSLARAEDGAPTPRLETENLRGELASVTESGRRVNHRLDFSTKCLPSVVSRQLWTCIATTLFLGIFLEKVPRAHLKEPKGHRFAVTPEFELLLFSLTLL